MGGALWMVHGVFLMLEPWGAADVYRDELGYQLVTNALLFWLYELPGSIAIFLTALGLVGITARYGLPASRTGKISIILTYITFVLAGLSLVGLVTLIAPLSFAGKAFGSLILGAATFLMGFDMQRVNQAFPWKTGLLILGFMGLLLLPLLPLVFAVELISAGLAAGVIAGFGLGWVLLGYVFWSSNETEMLAPPFGG
jgi:hypothetical protein